MSDLKKIVLIGAGGFGREVAAIIEYLNQVRPRYELLGFVDDGAQFKRGDFINGYPWLGTLDWAKSNSDNNVLYTCTVGNVHTRAKIQEELTAMGKQFETIVAYDAFVSPHTTVGRGCVLYPGVLISVNCEIGDGVLLNTRTNIGHDVRIGSFTTISPNTSISGSCTIGSQVNIGGHSFVIPGRKIADNAIVAAGSVVFTNVREGTTVLGNPAKRMKGLEA